MQQKVWKIYRQMTEYNLKNRDKVKYDNVLANCMKAAKAGGEAIRNYRPGTAETKDDRYVGRQVRGTSRNSIAS